ncbi:MAG: 4-hydroxy-3-methylbut-2-enyl diphosphate reductase [Candidatus Omnitrophota bacterium]
MKINIAKSSGFCFGVRRAINISRSVANKKKNVYVLGDIVHNSFVVNDLKKEGIKKIASIKRAPNSTLIIRAHGAPKKVFQKARLSGYIVVDATCPKVKEIYKIAKRLEKNNRIIIIGDNNHAEVKGIAGQLKTKPITIDSAKSITQKKLSHVKKAAVITQSTQTIDNINEIMARLKELVPKIKLYDTTCRTTRIKQKEIKTLPKENDVMLIIGSKTSANTKRLHQISKSLNRKTYWIECARDLKLKWFKKNKTTGIMAGASTPDYITKEVVQTIKRFAKKKKHKQCIS